jgi:glycosyltransferase involved in cell wall biosynthesis
VISIVTPSLNQGRFIAAALDSVATQRTQVEHVVMDGGSTDDTVATLQLRSDRLTAWRTGPDDGQYDAINKGFELTSGEIMGWLNADDFYVPHALSVVADVFNRHPEIEWVTSSFSATANEAGHVFDVKPIVSFDRRAFLRGYNLPRAGEYAGYFVPQESTFWRRSLWERAGGLDATLRFAGDFDLWARFYTRAELWCVRALIGVYRTHPQQKTHAYADYAAEAEPLLARYGGRRYSRRETKLRMRLARHLTNHRLWKLPTRARVVLEQIGIYRTPELMWLGGDARWAVNTHYFV